MAKYIAFDVEDTVEYFDTEEEARKWCEETLEIRQGDDDGISESAANGGIGYAKIIQESTLRVTETRADDYPCLKRPGEYAQCTTCENKDCSGTEEWPYGEFEHVGTLELVEVTDSPAPEEHVESKVQFAICPQCSHKDRCTLKGIEEAVNKCVLLLAAQHFCSDVEGKLHGGECPFNYCGLELKQGTSPDMIFVSGPCFYVGREYTLKEGWEKTCLDEKK